MLIYEVAPKQTGKISDNAFCLVSRLLSKCPDGRLGSHPADLQSIRTSRFFQTVDWRQVAERRLSCNLPLVLDSPSTPKLPRKRDVAERSLMSSEMAGTSLREEDIDGECSVGSLWVEGFTEGLLTQPATGAN